MFEVKSLSCVRLFASPWTVACQAPLSMGFPRQEYWSGLPFPFSRGSSQPRNWTQVSRIIGRHLPIWATREVHTIALISHASKLMLKFLQGRLQQYVNCELPDVQAGFRKGKGTRDQITNIHWIVEKARVFQKKNLLLLNWLCQNLWLWKILKKMGIPDHLTCLLRNRYAGQEARVRTGRGTKDWFQIAKGERQGCILSPCLFNLYAEWMKHKLESKLPGEITSDVQMTPPLWQKAKKN